jgi:hypothetical protein
MAIFARSSVDRPLTSSMATGSARRRRLSTPAPRRTASVAEVLEEVAGARRAAGGAPRWSPRRPSVAPAEGADLHRPGAHRREAIAGEPEGRLPADGRPSLLAPQPAPGGRVVARRCSATPSPRRRPRFPSERGAGSVRRVPSYPDDKTSIFDNLGRQVSVSSRRRSKTSRSGAIISGIKRLKRVIRVIIRLRDEFGTVARVGAGTLIVLDAPGERWRALGAAKSGREARK